METLHPTPSPAAKKRAQLWLRQQGPALLGWACSRTASPPPAPLTAVSTDLLMPMISLLGAEWQLRMVWRRNTTKSLGSSAGTEPWPQQGSATLHPLPRCALELRPPSACLFVHLSVCPPACLPVRGSVCLPIHPTVPLSVSLCAHLSVCLLSLCRDPPLLLPSPSADPAVIPSPSGILPSSCAASLTAWGCSELQMDVGTNNPGAAQRCSRTPLPKGMNFPTFPLQSAAQGVMSPSGRRWAAAVGSPVPKAARAPSAPGQLQPRVSHSLFPPRCLQRLEKKTSPPPPSPPFSTPRPP